MGCSACPFSSLHLLHLILAVEKSFLCSAWLESMLCCLFFFQDLVTFKLHISPATFPV